MINKTGFLRHFQRCNNFKEDHFRPFYVVGKPYGLLKPDLLQMLTRGVPGLLKEGEGLALADDITEFKPRSAVFARATEVLCAEYHKKVRNELYPLLAAWGDQPLAALDRVAVPWFGIRAFGIHVNGFVRKKGELFLWIGERAQDRRVDPGKLDNMIGGGQPIGLSIRENLAKEALEEAGLKASHVRKAQHVNTLRYKLEQPVGLRNDTLFLFDLELPEGVAPKNTDGEVANFHLLPAQEVAKIVAETDRFKFNCNLVIVDFLVRHGILKKDHPEFQALKDYLDRDAAEHIAITSLEE